MSEPSREESALIVVDVQNDFCPGGALAVPDGDSVVPVINGLMERFANIILTQDWHPPGHSSFASSHDGGAPFETVRMAYGEQELWPDHCIAGSHGAAFHRDLGVERAQLVVRKGFRREIDSYSAFYENDRATPTGLAGYLQDRGLRNVFLVGLATDFCVRFSALDAARLGFAAMVIDDACRGLDVQGSLEATYRAFDEAGVARAMSHGLDAFSQ